MVILFLITPQKNPLQAGFFDNIKNKQTLFFFQRAKAVSQSLLAGDVHL